MCTPRIADDARFNPVLSVANGCGKAAANGASMVAAPECSSVVSRMALPLTDAVRVLFRNRFEVFSRYTKPREPFPLREHFSNMQAKTHKPRTSRGHQSEVTKRASTRGDARERQRQAAVHAARGMFKHVPGSLDQFLEERHGEVVLEERKSTRH